MGNQAKQSRNGTKFQMLVEDIREGVLVSVHLYNLLLLILHAIIYFPLSYEAIMIGV